MSDPIALMKSIDQDAVRLDELEQLLGTCVDTLDQAEERWLEVRDTVAEALKDEMEKQGRKADPAEHWIDTQARKENRVAYTNLRRAKRVMDKIQMQVRAKQAAMSGRQSELSTLRTEGQGSYQPGTREDTLRRVA